MIVINEAAALRAQIADLVCAAQAGDRSAFGELVERFTEVVYATAMRRLRNHAEAQELSQDVFIQAYRKIGQLREPECFASWIRAIANRMAINRAVRAAPLVLTERETMEATCVDRHTPLAAALDGERRQEVRDGLSRLKPLDRRTLEAFYVEGQSLVEMSDAFASPVGTIKRRLHVARKRLARELEELAAV